MSSAYFENDPEPTLKTSAALGFIGRLLRPYAAQLSVCIGLLGVSTALMVGKGLLIKSAIDNGLVKKDMGTLLTVVGLYLLSQAILMAVNYAQRIKLESLGQVVISGLRIEVYRKVLGLSISYFNRNPSGRIMARVESDTESLRTLFTFAVTVIIGDFLLVAAMITTMWFVSPRLTLVVIAFAPVVLGLVYVYGRVTTPKFLESRKKMADVTATLTEFLHGMMIVQVFARGEYARERIREVNAAKFKLDSFLHIANTTFFNFIFLTEAAIITAILLWGGAWVLEGLVTIGAIVMFIQYLRKMFEPLYRFSEQMYVAQRAIAGAKRIHGVLQSQEFLPEPERPVSVTRIESGVRLDGVWFSYNGDERWALKDITLDIEKGKRIALVGVTGGGKSSIINLLLRFYDPQRGSVSIDGTDIRTMSKSELRGLFGLVLQDIYLFPGDVSSNISLDSPSISEGDIVRASQTVGVDEFINRLPGKYKEPISEKGSNLSRGERQLLSFARALAHNPQVLILDEATSSVDPETERRIQEALMRLLAKRTSVVVAHRLSTILSCDEIVVVKDGRIIERGTHEELELAGGYYHTLFKLQFADLDDEPGAEVKELNNVR